MGTLPLERRGRRRASLCVLHCVFSTVCPREEVGGGVGLCLTVPSCPTQPPMELEVQTQISEKPHLFSARYASLEWLVPCPQP